MLSRKNYIEIAKILKQADDLAKTGYHYTAKEAVIDLISEFIAYLKQDNPAFDVDKFNKAVYGGTKQ